MNTNITGIVINGVVVPNAPLPEGTEVEIRVSMKVSDTKTPVTASELRSMPREQRQAILAAAAALAEEDYRDDKELTAFEAFIEEERDDDESDASSR